MRPSDPVNRFQPIARPNMILDGTISPFAEADVLYNHIFSAADDIQLTLQVLSPFFVTHDFAMSSLSSKSMSPRVYLFIRLLTNHLVRSRSSRPFLLNCYLINAYLALSMVGV